MEDAEISKQWSYLSISFKRAITRVKMNGKQHATSLGFHQDTICNVQLAQCAAWFQKPVSPTLKNEDVVTAIWHGKTFFSHFGP